MEFETEDQVEARAARRGDREALDALWRRHRRWLAAVLVAHAPPDTEIEDLLQEVAAAVLGNVGTLDDPARLRPWLRRIAVNTARTAARARQTPAALDPHTLPDPAETHRDGAADRVASILALMRRLPAPFREVLVLRSVEGLSQRQIAETLGLPETTVETRLARARRRLRALSAEPARPAPGPRSGDLVP